MAAGITRQNARTELRLQLRDAATTLWTNAALNSALNEAARQLFLYHPRVQSTITTGTGVNVYALPASCLSVRRVFLWDGTAANPPEELPDWQTFKGLSTAYAAATNQYDQIIVTSDTIASTEKLIIYYTPTQADWGDATVVGSGVDTTAIDFTPDEGNQVRAELLFYAFARCAAYRYAMQLLPSNGGEDYGKDYMAAVAERDRLIAQDQGNRDSLPITFGVF